jgi:hypothetical protein
VSRKATRKPARPDPRQAAREALARRLAGLMAAAEPTAFALEGPARAALRARFILVGAARWTAADREARGIVASALGTLGSRGKRPTWQEGQPDFCGPLPLERTRCLNCGARLPGDNPARKHCSPLCRTAFGERMRYRAAAADGAAVRELVR